MIVPRVSSMVMSPKKPNARERSPPYSINRRRLLAVGGVAATGGLAGCLSRVASVSTNTGASPAAVLAGEDASVGEPHVRRLTPTLSATAGPLSGDVELEAWVTAVTLEDYNTPRSNRSATNPDDLDWDDDGVDDGLGDRDYNDVRGEDYNTPRSNRSAANRINIIDEDDDDVDEDDETVRAVLELEAALQGAADDAILAISKRSARTGRNPETGKEITEAFDEMSETLSEIRSVLGRVDDKSSPYLYNALERVDETERAVARAREHVVSEEWGVASEAIGGGGNDILVGDYLVAPGVDPSDEERDALVEYLSGSPMVGERFTVCLPDAEVPGGNGSLAEEVTPRRLIDYITGRSDSEGKVYAWGRKSVAGSSESCGDLRAEEVCGETEHLSVAISEPIATGGGLVSARDGGGKVAVTVTNTPPTASKAEAGASVLVCPVDDEPYEPADLGEWGSESGASSETPTVVCQVMVQPPECPVPVRALLYVKRCRSDDQLVYTGGWVLDEAGLFEDSVTALTLAGETQVVGIECCFDYNDAVSRSVSGERAMRGARVETGTVEYLVKAGVMSADGGGRLYAWGDNDYSKEETGDNDGDVVVTHCPLDAPVLHLVNAGQASNEAKFKAGAELSKSVN